MTAPHDLLDPPTRRVFEALIAGKSKSAIARELGCCESNITYRVRRINRFCQVGSLVELGAYAQRQGLIVGRG